MSSSLARRSVGAAGVEHQLPAISDDLGDELREIADADIFTGADIEEAFAGVMLHDEYAGIAKVVGSEKFAQRLSGSPDHDFLCIARLGRVKPPDQRGGNMAVLGMIIVARPVEIGRHHRDEVGAELPPVGLGKLDARDLRHGVPFVRRLERARQQKILRHRLRRVARENAG